MYPPFDVMQLLLTAHPDGEKDEREGFTAAVHYAVEKCDNCGGHVAGADGASWRCEGCEQGFHNRPLFLRVN